ncbi:hypothetical protein OM076_01705 [Solirubrobacter ginsenosidimutans]|uniref:Uncharacterized protein n=1 Tax=Solirubrobacter ginsenosidimutans TaxID=490573 RepID=A0A9X3MMG6_9ACTN|nr:hypothetical protein [Solirubrobacter ginsenosidimutans]MDA0158964.1 hypothetical protein [Solirubrobacter ginsenosidimutans]
MDLVITRRVTLGVAGSLAGPALDVAGASAHAAAFVWRTPFAAPVRRPARALVDAAERRGARDESWLIARAGQLSSDWFARALRAPVVDRVFGAVIEARLLERVTAEALKGEALEGVLGIAAERSAGIRVADAVLADDSVERLLAHVVDQPAIDRLIERALASPAFELRVAAVLEQPALEQVLERVLASRFAQAATDQLLASEELKRVVGHVARSDEVREALASQTHGLVDDVSDQLRDRTANVDDRMEGVARRLLRRHARVAPLASFDEGPSPA